MSSEESDLETEKLTAQRLSRPELFMSAAMLYARRSSCLRAQVGAVAVREGRIVSAGYVGAPAGMPDCIANGCEIENDGCIRSVHAEVNLIAWAARTGTPLQGTEIYCTYTPCLNCAKLLINVGITKYYFMTDYRDYRGTQLLWRLGIESIRLNEPRG
jgi:dCMP deaminase